MKKMLLVVIISLVLVLSGCNSDDLEPLETKISNLENDISALQLLLSEKEDYDDTLTRADIVRLHDEIGLLSEEITTLQSEIDLLVTGDETKQIAIDSLLLEILDLEDELASLVGVDETKQIAINSLLMDISDLEDEIALLVAVDETKQTAIDSLLLDISDLEDEIALLVADDETKQTAIDSLLLDISDLEDEIALLVSDDETKQTTIDGLLLDISALETELDLIEDFNLYVAPLFSNIPGNQVVGYQTDLDLLTLGITALDNIDGDVTSSITVDLADTSILTIGNYPVTYLCVDSDGNESTHTINLEVVDYDSVFDFVIINNGTEIMIEGFTNFINSVVSIPTFIGGLPVTEIDAFAFRSQGITTVYLHENLKYIGEYAFYDNDISYVSLPDSLESVDFSAFAYNNISGLSFGTGVTNIMQGAFKHNLLTSVIIPDNVEAIGHETFKANLIEEVTIGIGVHTISIAAFDDNAITSITIFGDQFRFNSGWGIIGFPIELFVAE